MIKSRVQMNVPAYALSALKYLAVFAFMISPVIIFSSETLAQSLSLDLGNGASLTGRVVQMILLITVISLAPGILVLMTSFTRIVIVLGILRQALGAQQTPPNMVIISLALFMTAYIMAPTFEAVYNQGLEPMFNEQIDEAEALERGVQPLKTFMISQVRDEDLELFHNLSATQLPAQIQDVELTKLIPAFVISELRRAFEIAFLIYVPFIIIDMVVASILMSMGMMMLPPVMIAMPFKLIFFVLVDGWQLVVGSLIQSFGTVPPPLPAVT